MQFTLDADPTVNLFRAYSTEEVRVGERVLQTSCIVTADTVIENWSPQDFEALFALEPDVVLLGTGETQQFPSSATRKAFEERRIALEAMTLGAACRTFNILVQEGRRVAAALLLKAASQSKPSAEGTGGESILNQPIIRS
jgi:uncharacterized protein